MASYSDSPSHQSRKSGKLQLRSVSDTSNKYSPSYQVSNISASQESMEGPTNPFFQVNPLQSSMRFKKDLKNP